MTPASTYRLQFGPHFRLADAIPLVPYFDALGVTHIYASPLLKARPGSEHGYDITDYNALNPEIGDWGEFVAFTDALKARGMGLILDFVPNHMGIGKADNAWWLDVLEAGPGRMPAADQICDLADAIDAYADGKFYIAKALAEGALHSRGLEQAKRQAVRRSLSELRSAFLAERAKSTGR